MTLNDPNDFTFKLLDTQRLIWSPFRSCRAIQGKRQQNYLYYKHATLLKFALSFFGTQSETVWIQTFRFKIKHVALLLIIKSLNQFIVDILQIILIHIAQIKKCK